MPTALQLFRLLFLLLLTSTPVFGQLQKTYELTKATTNTTVLKPGVPAMAAVVVDILPGFHAQSNAPLEEGLVPFTIEVQPPAGIIAGKPIFPPPQMKTYPALGKLSVYDGRVILRIPLDITSEAKPGEVAIKGKLGFQICDDKSCFPPEEVPFTIKAMIGTVDSKSEPIEAELFKTDAIASGPATSVSGVGPTATGGAATVSNSGEAPGAELFGWKIALPRDSVAPVLLVAFLAGIIFNVMPCVLPVLPLKAIGFYEASQHKRSRTLLFGLFFSLGVIAIFGVLAVIVLLSKQIFGETFSWGQQFSYPWFVWSVAILLGALGIGMMGAFALRLPTSVYGLNFRHDTLSGNFLWGGLTAVLSTPCTAPLFPVVLGWAIGQPILLGVGVVLMVGVGMAFPYMLLSAFPEMARRFPRTGPFSELIKQMMGFLLLASSAFFVGMGTLEDPNQWWLVLAVVIWGCLFLVIRAAQITKGSIAIMAATATAVLLGGGMLAITLKVTDTRLGGATANGNGNPAASAAWEPYSAEALAAARKSDKIVLVKFTAKWCFNCKYIEATVFQDPKALDALRKQGVVMLKADLTKNDALGWPLLRELTGGNGIPYTAVYHPGEDKPVGIASIYKTETLLSAIKPHGGGSPVTTLP